MLNRNRAERRRAQKAFQCFVRGTKVPGQIASYLGAAALETIATRAKMYASDQAAIRQSIRSANLAA